MPRINNPPSNSKDTAASSFWQMIEGRRSQKTVSQETVRKWTRRIEAARKSLRAGRGVRFEDINWS
jgi:hypothetical protein